MPGRSVVGRGWCDLKRNNVKNCGTGKTTRVEEGDKEGGHSKMKLL